MNGYPRDMFDEMDEIFAHLISRMEHDRLSGEKPVSGYRIVIQSSGYPPEPEGMQAVQPRAIQSPVPEVHRIDNEIKVIAELPGAPAGSVRLGLAGQRLTIEAGTPEMPYHTTADLPPVEAGSMQHTFRNGVLEVTFRVPDREPETS